MTEAEKVKKLIDFADKKFAGIEGVIEKMINKKVDDSAEKLVEKINNSTEYIDAGRIRNLPKSETKIVPVPQSGITTTFFLLNGTTIGRAKNVNFIDGTTLGIVMQGDQANVTIPSGGGGGSGTVTNVATGTGLTGGPISTTGTVSLNTKLAPLDTLTGNSLKFPRVNVGETALEYVTLATAGLQTSVQYQDEGSNLGTSGTVTEIDFVGAGITATRSVNKVTVTVPGGGGGNWTSGIVPPASTPGAIGDGYVDTATKFIYIATGTASSADWTIINAPKLLIQ